CERFGAVKRSRSECGGSVRAHSTCTANPSAGSIQRPKKEKIWSRCGVGTLSPGATCQPRSLTTSNTCPAMSPQRASGAYTARVNPSVSVGTLPAVHAVARDRKSTRLNSSHVAISYAVFCLKKKEHPVDHRLVEYTVPLGLSHIPTPLLDLPR